MTVDIIIDFALSS